MRWNYSREAPRHCPVCGADLSEHPYQKELPSRVARGFQRAAVFMLPVMIVVVAYLFMHAMLPVFHSGVSGYFFLVMIGGPSAVLASISIVFPRVPVTVCLRCNWHQDFSLES